MGFIRRHTGQACSTEIQTQIAFCNGCVGPTSPGLHRTKQHCTQAAAGGHWHPREDKRRAGSQHWLPPQAQGLAPPATSSSLRPERCPEAKGRLLLPVIKPEETGPAFMSKPEPTSIPKLAGRTEWPWVPGRNYLKVNECCTSTTWPLKDIENKRDPLKQACPTCNRGLHVAQDNLEYGPTQMHKLS